MNSLVQIGNVDNIAEHLLASLDISEGTRSDYIARIGMFTLFVQQHGLDHAVFLDFKRALGARNDLAVSTKNKYLAVARVLLKELNRQGLLPVDVTQNIKSFRQSKKHKKDGVTDDEMSIVASSLVKPSKSLDDMRLTAMISLLALQGLRQCELVRLNVTDLDLKRATAFVRGKGRDDTEIIYLNPQTVVALREYTESFRLADGALFFSRSNNSMNKRLTTRSVRQIVQSRLLSLGVDKNVHGFRHYFTTTLIKSYKGDLTEVARYTRHKSLETLQIYNDNIAMQADLPRFHSAFEAVQF